MKKDYHTLSDEETQDKAIEMFENISEISDKEIEEIDSNPKLLEICRDMFSIKKAMFLRETSLNVQAHYDTFVRSHHVYTRIRKKAVVLGLAVASVAAITIIVLTLHFKNQTIPIGYGHSQITFKADKTTRPITISGNRIQTVKVGKETNNRTLDVASITPNITDVFTVTVPKGDVYTIVLTDGTKVYLHPDSRLKFPTRFSRNERAVELIGEAYFDVTHDANRPFKVKAQGITTTVLGTEFNICAYQGCPPYVTLVSGSVKVSCARKAMVIKPGEQSTLTDDGNLTVSKVDTDSYTYWRDGFFYYDNVSLEEIMLHLGRTYNMSVEFLSPEMKDYKIHFVAKRSEKIDNVIRMLNKINRIHIIRKNNLLIVE